MNKSQFVDTLKDSFYESGFLFEEIKKNDYVWGLTSPLCTINISFEQHGNCLSNILFIEPGFQDTPLLFVILRFMFGASGAEFNEEEPSPEFYAAIMVKYFGDLLNGDFSIRERYLSIEKDFSGLVSRLFRLQDNHIARQKYAKFDISWMEEIAKIERAKENNQS